MNILILSPHTDDGELGAGATINKFLREGHKIHWIVFSTCEESLPEKYAKDELEKEFKNVVKGKNILTDIFHFKVRYLHEHRQDILEKLIKIRNEFKPDLVIGPSTQDKHQDHEVISKEMIRAFKSSSSIIGYELPWNQLKFESRMFVRVQEEDIEEKINMLTNYKTQLDKKRIYFNKEYVKGLAVVRGTQCNSKYAEAFEVIKWIQ